MKLVILVRTDLRMDKGKVTAQACHAALAAARACDAGTLMLWRLQGEPVVVVKTTDAEFEAVVAAASSAGIQVHRVYDAGRTQVEAGTLTVAALGPSHKDVTSHLKLY